VPELPEVEVIRRGLEPCLVNRRLLTYHYSGKKLRLPFPGGQLRKWVCGQRIIGISRRAKYLILELENGAGLVFHLGMTGRLGLFHPTDRPLAHDHLRLLLDNSLELRFHDTRRFGSVQVCPPDQRENFFIGLGVDPFSPDFKAITLHERAQKHRQPVKNFIMDGRIVVGIGNIYASEILFAAGIRPDRPAQSLSMQEWHTVVEASRKVLTQAIACGGTTISDFVGAGGEAGYFQCELQVYGQGGELCRRCGSRVVRTVMAGRATYYCSQCQQ